MLGLRCFYIKDTSPQQLQTSLIVFGSHYLYIKQGYEYHHSSDERSLSHQKYELRIMNYELKKVANERLP